MYTKGVIVKRDVFDVHVIWKGPYRHDKLAYLRNEDSDYGVYQVYGSHPVYGSDVLIYIGKAVQQTFGVRIPQSGWDEYNGDPDNLKVYVGRLAGTEPTPADEEWSRLIDLVEKLLIVAHWPGGNSANINADFEKMDQDVRVMNWGAYRSLLPEVSVLRYGSDFDQSKLVEYCGYSP
jgi:hypothetical protein